MKSARTGVTKVVVEVERFAWKELMLLTGVTTVEGMELEEVVLVAADNPFARVVMVGEDEVEDKAADVLVRGEEVVVGAEPYLPGTWQHAYCPEFSSFHFCVSDCWSATGSDEDDGEGEGGDSPQDDPADKSAGARPSHCSQRNSVWLGLNPQTRH